ncbi:hypothetical protein [Streptomyces sp. XD-27]|uniref:hypothetical protein n=1 Tax=Streptomyces sp. XD-27 TaxID=3062779 RepID=UPI0026F43C90|nr:hypothetical protein [Streptomyces sp. XD-27]WKX69892.1 hypothetical protein Q3Y56_08180 [Streptomyces sp. XD-27]
MSTSTEDTPQTPDNDGDGETTARRRRSPLAIASVAAAVLLAGGGGAYWAAAAGDGGGSDGASQGGSPEPLALDGYGGKRQGGHEGIAVGEHNPYGNRYQAPEKLPDTPDATPAYLTPGKVTKDEVARLAKALDVSGAPRLDHGVWKVGGTPDAMSPLLEVSAKGPGGWAYTRYGAPGGKPCVERPATDAPDDSVSSSEPGGSAPGKGREGCPTFRDGPQPPKGGSEAVSEKAAKRAAAPVLNTLGLDDAKLDARHVYGALRTVSASPVLDGLPTYGWQTELEIDAAGQLVGGKGMLSVPKKTADYPLIGAGEAIKQLNTPAREWRVPAEPGDCATPVPHKDRTDATEQGAAIDTARPCEPAPTSFSGSAQKPRPSKIVTSVFGLAAYYVDGRQALVPSWIFTVQPPGTEGRQAQTVTTYPAIAPKYIADQSKHQRKAPGDAPPGSRPGHPVEPGKPGELDIERAQAYTAKGKTLTLRFSGGVCSTYTATADESPSTVKVKITGKWNKPGRPCIAMAMGQDVKVALDKPLGDRQVVDAVSGRAVPER